MCGLSSIVENRVAQYIDFIKSFSDSSKVHHFSNKNGGFPILMPDNSTYNEQSFFDELIENSIWKYLINGILSDLLSKEYCVEHGIECTWTYMHPQLTSSYIEDIENRYPLEFIIVRKNRRIGYRYTNCYRNEEWFYKLFENNNLDELIVIDFSSKNCSSFLHPLIAPQNLVDKIKKVSFKDFFIDLFSYDNYLEYITAVRQAVVESYKYIGIQSVTDLTLQYLPFFLESESKAIRNFDYDTTTYSFSGTMNGDAQKWYDDGFIPESDKSIIKESFFNRFISLTGTKDFAKSFITSEYLYYTLKSNNHFDYTAVVSGYLKSIEQLLFLIVNSIISDGHTEDVWIQSINKKRKKSIESEFRPNPSNKNRSQVRISSTTKDYFDTTLGSLIYALHDYKNGWDISDKTINIISAWLLMYSKECRNDHFHKDNINDINEVKTIRNNTFLLLYYIIGGYNFSRNVKGEKKLLGIIDKSYNYMYHEIMRYGGGNYFLLFFEEKKPIYVALPMPRENQHYDEDGVMINPSLRFVRLDRSIDVDWHNDDWSEIQNEYSDEKTIFLKPDNMPLHIKYIDKVTNEQTDITW